jgi:hypothetical protein
MIRVGDPVLVLVLLGIHRPKVRCQALACAGEPVPAALPEAVVERASVTVMTRLGLLPLTFGREREVGEEG